MIFDAIFGLIGLIVNTLFGTLFALVPRPPTEFVRAISDAMDLMSNAYALDAWLPIDLAFAMVGLVLAAYVASFTIGVVRLVVSYFTFGSGAT